MILQYAMKIGEGMGKGSIKDAVIAVPPYFGQTARYALYDAADIAGLNILAEVRPRTYACHASRHKNTFSSTPTTK